MFRAFFLVVIIQLERYPTTRLVGHQPLVDLDSHNCVFGSLGIDGRKDPEDGDGEGEIELIR